MNASRARAVVIIAVVAVGSAIAGAGIDRLTVARSRHHRPPSTLSREEAARRRAEILEHMTKELSLTPAQRAGIDSIMQRTDSALRVVRSEMQPRLTQILDSSRARISARLDSTQRVKFAARRPPRRDGGPR